MRASSAHVAYRYPAQHAELTRHLRDRTPATIVRADTTTTGNGAAPAETDWSRSAADQLTDMERGDDWKRYVPIIGARPGYIPFTQPERAAVGHLGRLDRLALLFDCDGVPSSATAPLSAPSFP